MKTLTLLTFIIAAACVATSTWGETEEENVVVLTNANFDAFVEKHPYVLVKFYAPWCGHCKKMVPELSRAAVTLKASEPPVPLAKVDCTVETDLAQKFGIQGYPTLKWFVNGKAVDYQGGRVEAEIVQWVQKKTGPASRAINDKDDLAQQMSANKVLVVFFGAAGSDFNIYQAIAGETEGISMQHSHNESLIAEYGNKVVLFKKFDEGKNEMSNANLNADDFKAWIADHRFETVMMFEGDSAIDRVFGKEAPAMFIFTDQTESPELTAFAEVAKSHRGKIIFSHGQITIGLGQRLSEYVGITAEMSPAIRIVVPANGELGKYVYDGPMTAEAIGAWLDDYTKGMLNKTYKSQEIPEKNDEAVVTLVGKNFDSIAMDESKDVLVEFYAPWCGHCKSLAPKYEIVAQKVAHMDNIVIAKLDATENEIPNSNVKGFPTIKLYKGGRKSTPIEFEGDRSEEGIIKFLKENVRGEWTDMPGETDL